MNRLLITCAAVLLSSTAFAQSNATDSNTGAGTPSQSERRGDDVLLRKGAHKGSAQMRSSSETRASRDRDSASVKGGGEASVSVRTGGGSDEMIRHRRGVRSVDTGDVSVHRRTVRRVESDEPGVVVHRRTIHRYTSEEPEVTTVRRHRIVHRYRHHHPVYGEGPSVTVRHSRRIVREDAPEDVTVTRRHRHVVHRYGVQEPDSVTIRRHHMVRSTEEPGSSVSVSGRTRRSGETSVSATRQHRMENVTTGSIRSRSETGGDALKRSDKAATGHMGSGAKSKGMKKLPDDSGGRDSSGQ